MRYEMLLAERAGFEPALGYYPKHAFQACDLNRSSTSPECHFQECKAMLWYSPGKGARIPEKPFNSKVFIVWCCLFEAKMV